MWALVGLAVSHVFQGWEAAPHSCRRAGLAVAVAGEGRVRWSCLFCLLLPALPAPACPACPLLQTTGLRQLPGRGCTSPAAAKWSPSGAGAEAGALCHLGPCALVLNSFQSVGLERRGRLRVSPSRAASSCSPARGLSQCWSSQHHHQARGSCATGQLQQPG